eukprot:CAMPEP_0115158156 /NCGR_PEP_ID=MMETSP0227-20121206/69426_1 /TAXON_ID=89957 /ORGANISM="Polarella glacialis, Strain CCMP 1383" /LENGTH=507 /DNA_ID=CAMNT_0002569577 /DNA_START=131 /DNA_END=1653 /DNA_ORIENTATION=-
MGSTTANWAPQSQPRRQSPFYSLKSVAFALEQPPLTSQASITSLVPASSSGSAAGKVLSRDGTRQFLESVPDEEAAEADLLDQLQRRRIFAVTEIRKAGTHMQQLQQRRTAEQELRADAERQLQELRQQSQTLAQEHQCELALIRSQQETLQTLRGQVRGRLQKLGVEGTKSVPTGAAHEVHSGKQERASRSKLLVPALPLANIAEGVAGGSSSSCSPGSRQKPSTAPRPSSGSQSARVSSRGRHKSRGAGGKKPSTAPWIAAAAQSTSSQPRENLAQRRRLSEETQAFVEMMPAPGVESRTFARLWNPCGSEAVLDVSSGRLCLWRLRDGRGCSGVAPRLLRPCAEIASTGQKHDRLPSWTVVSLDYLNNEPSVTLELELNLPTGDGNSQAAVVARRTITLRAEEVCEELVVSRRDPSDDAGSVSFSVVEEEIVSEALSKEACSVLHAAHSRSSAGQQTSEFTPQVPRLALPMTAIFLPGCPSGWSARRRFAVPGVTLPPLSVGHA